MGFFGKENPPPQDTIDMAPTVDPEKQVSSHHEPEVRTAALTVDPAVESRLLRKLDWNLVTLVSFLCMISSPDGLIESDLIARFACVLGPEQYRVRVCSAGNLSVLMYEGMRKSPA